MTNWEKTIIPLNEAHEVLSMFGIGSSSRGYQRWRRDDGFRHVDFEGVLNESNAIIVVDGREWLQDAMNKILGQLQELDINSSADLGEEGNEGTIEIEGRSEQIKFVPEDGDDFDLIITAINRLVGQKVRYRKLRSCVGSDSWAYAVLRSEDWQELEANAGSTVKLLFA